MTNQSNQPAKANASNGPSDGSNGRDGISNKPILQRDSWRAVLKTSLEFNINDLRKRKSKFLMSMFTVMLTVSFITLLDCLCQLTPIPALKNTIAMSGDFELILMANTGRLQQIKGNTNFYTDENEFFNAPHLSQSEKEAKLVEQSFKSWFPFVNYTQISADVEADYKRVGLKPPVGLFPRWIVQTIMENPANPNQFTSAYMIAGDSLHERNVGLASGFPVRKLNRHETITTNDVLSVLGAQVGDQVQISFDFFQMISTDFNKLKRLAYDYQSIGRSEPQGEAILNLLNLPIGATMPVRDFIGKDQLDKIKRQLTSTENSRLQCLLSVLDFVSHDEYVRLSALIEKVLPCTTPEIFTMKKNYTIVEAVEDSHGKWPNQLGNGWFTDSYYLLDDLIDMVVTTVPKQLTNSEQEFGNELANTLEEIGALLKSKNDGKLIENYALLVAGKYYEREDQYVRYAAETLLGRGKLRLMEVLGDFISFLQKYEGVRIAVPFIDVLEKVEVADSQVGSIILTVVIFLFILDFIVIYTIMLSDVDERTYDFAMLRCLGFKSTSLIILLLMQALLYSIPATLIGFMLLEIFTSGAQIWLYYFAGISLTVTFSSSTYWLGLATGIMVPLISNMLPIKKALGTTLRDALDKSRASVNEQEVEVVRLENMGINSTQMSVSTAYIIVSFITLIMIPMRTFNAEPGKVFGWLNILLVIIIVGTIFTSQAFAPGLSNFFLKAIIFTRPKDKLLLPLIEKNLESHGLKNMKSTLMYTVALTFLVYVGTNFTQVSNFLKDALRIAFGADFTLKSISYGQMPKFDEIKIATALDNQLRERGGIVESYSMLSATISSQFRAPGSEVVQEQIMGIGNSRNKGIKNLLLNGIGENHMKSLNKDRVWYPGVMMHQPLGDGTQTYDFSTLTEMMMDMQPYSGFDEPFDSIGILSGRPNKDVNIKGEVLNLILPQAAMGEIVHEAGDYFTYCVSSPTPKRFHDLSYAANQCQIKFKARAVATFNKMPGLPRFTGYKQGTQLGVIMLGMDHQITSIIERMVDTFPEFAEMRRQVVQEMPASYNDIMKESLFMKMVEGADQKGRLKVQNELLANVEETNFILYDMQKQFEDLDDRNTLLRFFHTLSTVVCLILSAFQLVVTVSANISDSMWELGVLRSMGCTRAQITSVIVYELISTTMAAVCLGYVCGLCVSILSINALHTISELPMHITMNTKMLLEIFVFAIFSMIFGAKYGTTILFKRNIASILKGQ